MAKRNVIHRALATHLKNNFSLAEFISWENTQFDPPKINSLPSEVAWFEEIFIPNDVVEASIGVAGTQEDFGLYQINIRIPLNRGTIQSDNYVNELSQLYKIGTELEKDGETVYIEGSSAAQGIPEDSWYFVPFTIKWSCYMTKN